MAQIFQDKPGRCIAAFNLPECQHTCRCPVRE